MHYWNLFRCRDDVQKLLKLIKASYKGNINIMEVCGTHTMAIAESGIKQLLPGNIRLISGPGCPVCVTPSEKIDDVYQLSRGNKLIIATYGDMFRVPGSKRDISLEMSKMEGADIRMIYSSMDALNIAVENPDKEVVFLGIGFETTTPASSSAILEAYENKITNFSVYNMHKTIEPAIRTLLDSKEIRIDGFLLPGHVAIILGIQGFKFLEEEYCTPGVIAGFEPVDILNAIFMITRQIEKGCSNVENEYTRLVNYQGNISAISAINEVFEPCDDVWRGIGSIKSSGLRIKNKYKHYDAVYKFDIKPSKSVDDAHCRCGELLKGLIEPIECPLFGKDCTPDSPIGPCMVSSEGSCAAAYKYR